MCEREARWVMGTWALIMAIGAGAAADDRGPGSALIHVGIDAGDIRGSDQRALQAAVDQVADLGGGTVFIGPGRYMMRNALRLRDHVTIRGVPGQTILAACDGAESRLSCDGDCNERQVTLDDPAAFHVGDGVSIQDEHLGGGFTVTTATLTARLDDHTFAISAPLYLDYMVAHRATARIAFPIVGGWGVRDAAVAGLTIAGNRTGVARSTAAAAVASTVSSARISRYATASSAITTATASASRSRNGSRSRTARRKAMPGSASTRAAGRSIRPCGTIARPATAATGCSCAGGSSTVSSRAMKCATTRGPASRSDTKTPTTCSGTM